MHPSWGVDLDGHPVAGGIMREIGYFVYTGFPQIHTVHRNNPFMRFVNYDSFIPEYWNYLVPAVPKYIAVMPCSQTQMEASRGLQHVSMASKGWFVGEGENHLLGIYSNCSRWHTYTREWRKWTFRRAWRQLGFRRLVKELSKFTPFIDIDEDRSRWYPYRSGGGIV